MQWSGQNKISNTNFYSAADQYSKCSAVVFNNLLYLFFPIFDQSSGNRTVGYTTYDGKKWTQTETLASQGVALASATSPYAAVYRSTIYLFYNGAGNDGTYYAKGNQNGFTTGFVSLQSKLNTNKTFGPGTSPSASVSPDGTKLRAFWNDSNDNSIWYGTADTNENWSGPSNVSAQNMGVASYTSTSALATSVNVANTLLFFNGSGNDGTWLTKYNDGSAIWANANEAGGGGFLSGTSPTAWTLPDDKTIGGVWCGSGSDGLWYATSTDGGSTWSVQRQATSWALFMLTSPAAVSYQGASYLFWFGSGGDGIWFVTGK